MLLSIVLIQFHMYISFVSASTIKHLPNVGQNVAQRSHSSTPPETHAITSAIASRLISRLTGRALDLNRLLPRDDKMDDLFLSQDTNQLGDYKGASTKSIGYASSLKNLPLGDLTKTVDFEQLDNSLDEPEMVVNNHQVTPNSNLLVTTNSRHYNNVNLGSNANALFPHGNQYGHSNSHHQYGKYSPNMFANNYNLNYIHSFLTSKPTAQSTSLNLQTMQSLLNSNPNGLSLAPHNSAPSVSGATYVSASTLPLLGMHNARPQQVSHYSLIEGGNVAMSNATTSLAPDYSSPIHCGRQQVAFREPRIVGGNNSYEGEFPWAVSIQRHGNHHCGGVIVGHRWILTAAHCVRSQLASNLAVRTGGHTLTRSINSINSNLERDFPVEQIIMHDDFSRYDNLTSSLMKSSASTNNADIALLRLKQEIRWNEFAWPVCFPNRDAGNFSGHEATVIGWGKLNEKSEEFSNELQKVKLTIIDNKVCQNWFRQAGREMPIDDRIICAGFKSGGKDACHGDSGGPLLSRLNGQYVVVGVVSTGIGCARPLLPGLYSRVSSYIGWIERHITN